MNDLTFFTEKHNKYATREAVDVINRRYGLFDEDEALTSRSASFQAAFKRAIKQDVYNRLPFWMGPFAYFVYRYFVQLGFLDGRSGLIYHFLQGGWYRFLVAAKVSEYEAAMASCVANVERIRVLESLTGYKLADEQGARAVRRAARQ